MDLGIRHDKSFVEKIDHIIDRAQDINGHTKLGDFAVTQYTLDQLDKKFNPLNVKDNSLSEEARKFLNDEGDRSKGPPTK